LASDIDRDNALFVNLVIIFQSAAMQQMGKIMNPITGKVEKNLEQARYSIDILSMLKEKTRGNLSDDLERLLDSALLQLRMNYVEEAAAETSGGGESSSGGETSGGETSGGAAGEQAPADGRPAVAAAEPEARAATSAEPEPEAKPAAEPEAGAAKTGRRKGAGRGGRKPRTETK
jgi:hypothetical protein